MFVKWLWFAGRASRQEYWLVSTVSGVIFTIFLVVSGVMAAGQIDLQAKDANTILKSIAGPGMFLLMGTAGVMWLNYMAAARRLHDRDKSAWWVLAYLGPGSIVLANEMLGSRFMDLQTASFIGILAILAGGWNFLELGFMAGTDGPNRFDSGPRAKATAADDFAGSWADRPIEEFAIAKVAARGRRAQAAVRPASMSGRASGAARSFGRRGQL